MACVKVEIFCEVQFTHIYKVVRLDLQLNELRTSAEIIHCDCRHDVVNNNEHKTTTVTRKYKLQKTAEGNGFYITIFP